MSTNTLTSLAILKVNIDHGKDYLEYLRPFVLQVLVEYGPAIITDQVVSTHIKDQFGLQIPKRTVQRVLQRISKKDHCLKRDHGVYRITGDLPDPQITAKQSHAERHIEAVLSGLCQFSNTTIKPLSSDKDAIIAICAFLAEFDITCLRAYLRGTAIPQLEGDHKTDIVLVSKYVQHVRRTDPERFDSFIVLVQGHMLANALLCPDLHNTINNYENVTFYLDTPLLIQRLGLEDEAAQDATRELISLLSNLRGKVAAFSHSREELHSVLKGAAAKLDVPDGRGTIVVEARKRGTTKSDLLLLTASIDNKLSEAGIKVEATPHYIESFQIDETAFENVLGDELSYLNPRAKDYDINSVRSIYVIRANKPASSLEKARAVFVTSNTAFAKAAWTYGQQFESSKGVSSVISDFSLANIAWLKAPMGALSIPHTQLLAFSYAALKPSSELLSRYMTEIDRLENQKKITEHAHQLLRSSPLVDDELMDLTLGEEVSLTTETVTETLRRVSSEIKKEESAKLTAEQEAHRRTVAALNAHRAKHQKVMSNLYWKNHSQAKVLACALSTVSVIVLMVGVSVGLGLISVDPIIAWGSSIGLTILTLANLMVGSTVSNIHQWVQDRCLTWLLKNQAKAVDVDQSEFSDME